MAILGLNPFSGGKKGKNGKKKSAAKSYAKMKAVKKKAKACEFC